MCKFYTVHLSLLRLSAAISHISPVQNTYQEALRYKVGKASHRFNVSIRERDECLASSFHQFTLGEEAPMSIVYLHEVFRIRFGCESKESISYFAGNRT